MVGFTAGFGELAGYGLRPVFGWFADRTGQYWLTTIVGYAVNLFAVPALALAGNWQVAAVLVIAERAGRAMRKPPAEAMLSAAGSRIGQGWAFGLNEALDQAGATFGPLVMALVLVRHGSYRTGYALLLISVGFALATVLVARHHFPRPGELDASAGIRATGLSRSFWWYMLAGGCIAAGFADFALVGYHLQQVPVVSKDLIPIYYAVAMGVGALGALVLGRLFDRYGIWTLLVTFFASAFFAPLVFLGNGALAFAGIILWGLGMATQESLLKPLVAQILTTAKKATAFGLYDTGYGAFWFAGSWLMGYLYGRSVHALVIFSVCIQLISLPARALRHAAAVPPSRVLTLAGLQEPDHAQGAEGEAVDGEWGQGPGLEPADEEPHGQVRGDPADDDAEDGLAVDVRSGRAEQRGDLEHAGRQDDRGGQQEGEPGRVFVVQAAPQPAGHGDAGPADPREQREDLGSSDQRAGRVKKPGDAGVGPLGGVDVGSLPPASRLAM
jgi:predicted MFS family arabinose efflux permease